MTYEIKPSLKSSLPGIDDKILKLVNSYVGPVKYDEIVEKPGHYRKLMLPIPKIESNERFDLEELLEEFDFRFENVNKTCIQAYEKNFSISVTIDYDLRKLEISAMEGAAPEVMQKFVPDFTYLLFSILYDKSLPTLYDFWGKELEK